MSARTWLAAGLCLIGTVPAVAQIDYRNLDLGRPGLIEDAYPVERYAFDLALSADVESFTTLAHWLRPGLSYGVVRNGQVGVELPFAVFRGNGVTDWGLAGPSIHGMYNFNTDGKNLPALSLGGEVRFPFGVLADRDVAVTLKALATRSLGHYRSHVNGAYRIGGNTGPKWWAGLALDRTLYRKSWLLVGELYASHRFPGPDVEFNGSLGVRVQAGPTLVLHAGASQRLGNGIGPNTVITLGLSHGFAIARLMPGRTGDR